MNSMKIFTTPTVQGMEIKAYHGIVVANQVAGTGFLSDFTASVSDVFGGTSGTYRRQMNDLYDNVMDQLCEKAGLLGANGIIGVSIDYDEISGKGVSMFMISVQGTAVTLGAEQASEAEEQEGLVSKELLERHFRSFVLNEKMKNGKRPSDEEWKYILSHNMIELAPALQKLYMKLWSEFVGANATGFTQCYHKYIVSLPFDKAVELAYNPVIIEFDVIKENNLFCAPKVAELLDVDKSTAIELLSVDKKSYSADDLADMKALVDKLDNLPDTGKKEEVAGGLFSSAGLKYICEKGHRNDADQEFCTACGRNIKGLTEDQVNAINLYKKKVELLEELLNRK